MHGDRAVRRTRYLACGLLMAPAVIAGILCLALGADVPRPARGNVNAPQAAGPCGSAAGRPCAASPFHASLAKVPGDPAAARANARGVSGTGPTVAPPDVPADQPGTPAEQALALINQARSAAGLPPLTITAGLDSSASAHDLTMAAGCGLSHRCPGEPALGARETAAGVDWADAGENIGEGGPVADTTSAIARMAVVLSQDMLNEQPPFDGHRMNILSTSFTHIGIAVYRDSSGTVWLTQDFSS
jgi:uncharacterized protein YkwD